MAEHRSRTLVRAMHRLENAEVLDPAVAVAEPLAGKLVDEPLRRRILHGRALGHAIHPLMTDVPIGTWLSAAILDLTAGEAGRDAARRLVGVGVLAAAPTAITGWAEWAETGQRVKRVGVVHAATNAGAVVLNAASWLARRRGSHAVGAGLSLAASAGLVVGGYLGGHMVSARKVSTHDPSFGDADLIDDGDLTEEERAGAT